MWRDWMGLGRRARGLRRQVKQDASQAAGRLQASGWWRAGQRVASPEMIPKAFLAGYAMDQLRALLRPRPVRAVGAGLLLTGKLIWVARHWLR